MCVRIEEDHVALPIQKSYRKMLHCKTMSSAQGWNMRWRALAAKFDL
jgi:hypothetical protein